MRESLRKSYLGAVFGVLVVGFILPSEAQSYLQYYDPKKGFGKADKSMTTIFLKIAGSLEHHGSPEPYIRHVLAEHKRIDAKYLKATGKAGSARPEYFTDEYLASLLANWKKLEKPLQLEQLCRDSGRYMRHAIRGVWHKTADELVADETKLTEAQKKQYRAFLLKEHFKKSDFAALEAFYSDNSGYDNLTIQGKGQMSQRVQLGTKSPEDRARFKEAQKGGTSIVRVFNEYQKLWSADTSGSVSSKTLQKMLVDELQLASKEPETKDLKWDEEDAVKYSNLIRKEFDRRTKYAKEKLGEEAAKDLKAHFLSVVEDLRILAHSELHAGVREKRADKKN